MGSSMLATCFYIVMMWLMWYEVFPTEFTNSRMTTRGWEGLTHIAPRWFVFNMPAFIAWSAIYLVIEAFGRIRAHRRGRGALSTATSCGTRLHVLCLLLALLLRLRQAGKRLTTARCRAHLVSESSVPAVVALVNSSGKR